GTSYGRGTHANCSEGGHWLAVNVRREALRGDNNLPALTEKTLDGPFSSNAMPSRINAPQYASVSPLSDVERNSQSAEEPRKQSSGSDSTEAADGFDRAIDAAMPDPPPDSSNFMS